MTDRTHAVKLRPALLVRPTAIDLATARLLAFYPAKMTCRLTRDPQRRSNLNLTTRLKTYLPSHRILIDLK